MTTMQRQLTIISGSLGLMFGVLIPRAANDGLTSASTWWGVVTGFVLVLATVAVLHWRKRTRTGTQADG